MSTLTAKWRTRRQVARQHREFGRALDRAGSPGLRDELLAIAARGNSNLR